MKGNVVRIRKIAVGELEIRRITCLRKPRRCTNRHALLRLIKELERKFNYFKEESGHRERMQNRQIEKLNKEVDLLQSAVSQLNTELAQLRVEVYSGVMPNPGLQASFQSKLDQTVTVSTPDGNITGVVIVVGTDAVELRETTGNIVIIPYSQVTAVQ
ncbi:hypothetical protein LLE49_23200 [Alicyclobacillus tolerans]|uniref:hypothetical protein n=1 Tax=Alicyclobacillus tolerans TaxID=90970 RepID=UPI001F2AD598|nr:hypothetical protein [Alicyclobacillus tolerans]MCF8567630.1 hypothetical protein [Alicyclobacillus tolerans]